MTLTDNSGDFIIKHNGKKHNVAKFLKFHPGGSNTLKYFKDGDITDQLIQTHHSPSAYELLKDYKVSDDNPREFVRDEGDIEHLVDWNKPMFWQVGSLGPRYREWVLAPVDRKLRLFHSDFIERLTRTPVFPDNSPLLITLHFGLHGLHHKVPFDDGRLLFPPVPAGILMYLGYSLVNSLFIPTWCAPLVLAGVITGYVTYDLIHFYLHYGSPKEGSYLYGMKRYHNQHHFAHYESGFGISSKFWDHVFGTLIVLRKLTRTLR
ncbi:hypothetical protein WDU94_015349 [Cyamophila willieti]